MIQKLKRKVPASIYHAYKSLQKVPALWVINRLRRAGLHQRRQPGRVRIFGWDIEYVDALTASGMLRIQVLEQYNDFICDTDSPYILDCGSNIGISVLRYKQLYPNSRIIAFEPDHEICTILRRNLARNHAADVEVVEAAVWTEATSLPFFQEGTDSGYLLTEGRETAVPNVKEVKTIRFADYLNTPVDFVKIDIEGAELAVLESCASLHNIKKMIVEVHYKVDNPTFLGNILEILSEAGFKVSVNTFKHITLTRPFQRIPGSSGDQWPVVCAWRQSDISSS